MLLGFNQATTLGNSTLEQDLHLCEEYRFDYIEIRIDKLKEYLIDNSVDDLVRFFSNSHLKPLSFNALEFFNFQNDTYFNNMMHELRWLSEIGEKIDCQYVVAVPSLNISGKTKQQIHDESIKKLYSLIETIKDSNMKIALEFIGYPNASINTLEQAWEIVKEVDHEKLGLVLDCFHLIGMNSQISSIDLIDPSKLFLFHIDDCEDMLPGMLRDHHRIWPGDGIINLNEIINRVERIGYKGPATIELFRPEYWELDPQETIQISKAKMDCLSFKK